MTLLVGAIVQANVQHILRDPKLRLALAHDNELPPDGARRPVSINALSTSLQLPFETVRRHLRRLADAGECSIVAGGVIVPLARLTTEEFQSSEQRAYERVKVFYQELQAKGLLDRLPAPRARIAAEFQPIRAVNRHLGVYLLRVAESVGAGGDLIERLACQEIFRANVAAWPFDLDPRDRKARALPSMSPISVAALARRLGLPLETTRRRVAALVANGTCSKVGGGIVINAGALARPPLAETLQSASDNLSALFAVLAELGVLHLWDTYG